MDKRERHRAMLKEIEAGATRFVFYSRKLTDEQPRNCQFCGDLFLPGTQPGLDTPYGPAHWRRTLCSDECQGLRYEMRRRSLRAGWIKKGSTPGVSVNLSAIRERDGFTCYLCGGQTERGYKGRDTRLKPETDHIVPLSGGGAHHPDNIRCCCSRCNLEKGAKTIAEAVRISSCGDIDFDDPSLVEEPPTLEDLVSAWKQWVLPAIDDRPEVQAYVDRQRADHWMAMYRKRIAALEAFAATEPGNLRRAEEVSSSYLGFSDFLARYGWDKEALQNLRKRMAVCERLAMHTLEVNRTHIAACLFRMTLVGADLQEELASLSSKFPPEQIEWFRHAVEHMEWVAQRRAAEATQGG